MNSVALLVYPGEEIHPDTVTKLLGITPTKVNIPGQILPPNSLGRRRKVTIAGWFLDSEGMVESSDFNSHIAWLLQQLLPVKKQLRTLQTMKGLKMFISHSFWATKQGDTITVLPAHLKIMAELRLELGFDIYMWEIED